MNIRTSESFKMIGDDADIQTLENARLYYGKVIDTCREFEERAVKEFEKVIEQIK